MRDIYRFTGALLVAGITASAVLFGASPAPTPAAGPGAGLLADLRARASGGNAEAARALADLDAFLARTGTRVEDANH